MSNDTHKRWVKKLYTAGGSPDCQCLFCQYYLALQEPLGYNWGVCANPKSACDGAVVSEHAGCAQFKRDGK